MAPPDSKPDWRLRGYRAWRAIFGTIALVMLLAVVGTALDREWAAVGASAA